MTEMGENIEVLKCDIAILGSTDDAYEIMVRHEMENYFEIYQKSLEAERSIPLDSNFYLFLAELSNVARGRILFLREYEVGVLWQIQIKDGKVTESCADLNFKEVTTISLPRDVARKEAVVNGRYIATTVSEPHNMLVAYDFKKKGWIILRYNTFSLEDLILFEKLSNMEDVPNHLYSPQPPSLESLLVFTYKILDEYPNAEQRLREVLSASL